MNSFKVAYHSKAMMSILSVETKGNAVLYLAIFESKVSD